MASQVFVSVFFVNTIEQLWSVFTVLLPYLLLIFIAERNAIIGATTTAVPVAIMVVIAIIVVACCFKKTSKEKVNRKLILKQSESPPRLALGNIETEGVDFDSPKDTIKLLLPMKNNDWVSVDTCTACVGS